MKLNGTHQFLVYADNVNIQPVAYQLQTKTQVLVATSKDIGLEVNADKTKYMVMSQDQNAG